MGSSGMASSTSGWLGTGGGSGSSRTKAPSGGGAHNKITKVKGKMVVKPILKKLSNSEKNSLDLDRGWEDQLHDWSGSATAAGSTAGGVSRSVRDVTFVSSAFIDLTGSSNAAIGSPGSVGGVGGVSSGLAGGTGLGGDGGSGVVRPKFQHTRSPSGASHISVGTTSSSGPGGRSGTFVHPFQQIPRTATPPLSYANSLASFDGANPSSGNSLAGRDYSPTITEHVDGDYADSYMLSLRRPPSASHLAHSRSHSLSGPGAGGGSNPYPHPPHSLSQSSLRRPSLVSQRTSSFSDANTSSASALTLTQSSTSGTGGGAGGGGRLTSTRPAGPASSARMVHGGSMLSSSKSQSDLHLNLTVNTSAAAAASSTIVDGPHSSSRSHFYNSPHNTTGRTSSMQSSTAPPPPSASSFAVSSPTSSFSTAPMSPLRSSLEVVANGLAPRLRSLSEQPDRTKTMMDPVEHARLMREARAKFDEKERLKNEKLAKKRGRALSKEAEKQQRDLEKHQRQARPLASNNSVDHLPRPSTAASTSHNSVLSGGGRDWRRRYGGPGSFTPPAGYMTDEAAADQQQNEKVAFPRYSDGDHNDGQSTANPAEQQHGGRRQQQHRRRGSSSAKRRTHGYWTSVILWIRTKIFKLSRGD